MGLQKRCQRLMHPNWETEVQWMKQEPRLPEPREHWCFIRIHLFTYLCIHSDVTSRIDTGVHRLDIDIWVVNIGLLSCTATGDSPLVQHAGDMGVTAATATMAVCSYAYTGFISLEAGNRSDEN